LSLESKLGPQASRHKGYFLTQLSPTAGSKSLQKLIHYQRSRLSLQRPTSNSPSFPLPHHPETPNVSLLLSSRHPTAAIAAAAHRVPKSVHSIQSLEPASIQGI